MSDFIYKILRTPEWEAAKSRGVLSGSADDERDGFIHFSTREQLEGTLARHFAGESGLMLLEVRTEAVSANLRWEPSRGGALFPHLYADLPLAALNRALDISMTAAGGHALPADLSSPR